MFNLIIYIIYYILFVERSTVMIRFERYEHGDGDDFDGAGGTLGTLPSPFQGDVDSIIFWVQPLFFKNYVLTKVLSQIYFTSYGIYL